MQWLVDYLERRRREMVLAEVRGRLLDIGCGNNRLVRSYGNGVGVDVHPWEGVDVVVRDTARLPFPNASFETVSFVACLNHIPNRGDVLREARRCLAPGGRLLATMIGPGISNLWHRIIRPWDDDQVDRGMRPGEVWGMTRRDMVCLLQEAGFRLAATNGFIFGLNTLYVCDLLSPKPSCSAGRSCVGPESAHAGV